MVFFQVPIDNFDIYFDKYEMVSIEIWLKNRLQGFSGE